MLPDAIAAKVYRDGPATLAGVLFPPGAAIRAPGGWRVTAGTPFASGCHNAAWWSLPAVELVDGEARLDPATGMPTPFVCLIPLGGNRRCDEGHSPPIVAGDHVQAVRILRRERFGQAQMPAAASVGALGVGQGLRDEVVVEAVEPPSAAAPDSAQVHHVSPELADEERVASSGPPEMGGKGLDLGVDGPGHQTRRELGQGLVVETVERHTGEGAVPGQVCEQPASRLVGVLDGVAHGGRQAEPPRATSSCDVLEQPSGRLPGPVQIVHHEQDGRLRRQSPKQVEHGLEHPVPRRGDIGVGRPSPAEEPGKQNRQVVGQAVEHRVISFPVAASAAVRKLCELDQLRVADLTGLSPESQLVVARRLLREGAVRPAPPA